MILGQHLGNAQNVVRETHVEHAVCLVEHKEGELRQVHMSHADVRQQTPWCGDDNVSTHLQTFRLYVKAVTVVASIDCHAADAVKIVAEALHGLVYLLRQLAGG